MRRSRKRSLDGILFTIAVLIAVELIHHTTIYIPNLDAIFLLVVGYAAFRGGVRVGLMSAALILVYVALSTLGNFLILVLTTPLIAYMGGTVKSQVEILADEQRASTQLLRDTLQRLDFHVQNSPLAAIERDRHFRITRWSKAAENIFGWTAAEVMGKSPEELQLVFAEDLEIVKNVRNRLVNGVETHNISINRSYRKDGSIIYCQWYNSALLDEAGNLVSVLSLVLDNTARQKAEQALKASEEQFRLVIDAIPSLVAYVDREQRYRFNNKTYEDWWGCDRASLVGKTVEEIVGSGYETIRPYIETALSGESVTYEGRVSDQAGEVRDIYATYVPDFTSEGTVNGFVSLVSDISQLKRTQVELQNANQQIVDILESITDAFVACDRSWRYIYVNEEAARLLKKSREELLGKPLGDDLFSDITNSLFYQEAHRAVTEQVAVSFEEFSEGLDSWLEMHLYPNPLGLGIYFRDISDRHRAEKERERLLQREQEARSNAEAANRLKDEFLATLSHELRSPLNAILGWTNLLLNRQFDAATTTRALETIDRNAKAQAQLVEDILDVSRIIQGKMRLKCSPVAINSVIEAALDTIRPTAQAKGIQLHFPPDPAIGQVLGDPNRLQQIIWNLLTNAVKFTSKGGSVEVCTQQVDRQVEISITDTGQGIEPEFLPHVFDRFRQADSSITRSHGGLGLGLAIVRHLVDLHGGTVQVESPGKGQGATFTVTLPTIAVPDLQAATSQSGEDLSQLVGLKILVVDDEADVRELVTFVLNEYGAIAQSVSNAEAALKTLAQSQFDVLISDIGMPGTDGYSLIKQVRSLSPHLGGQIPAIALTAYARTEERQAALKAGFQVHLTKPVDPIELVKAIVSLRKH